MRLIGKLVCALTVSGAWLLASPDDALAACAGGSAGPGVTLNRTFASGSKWTFTVHVAPCEGLLLTNVRFMPAFGTERLILSSASLAEVHVPYDDNSKRFLDVTDSTSGLGTEAISLAAAECPGGITLGDKVCIADEDHGYRWKYRSDFAEMHAVSVFMASQLGEYTYINRWTFHEDGSIEPSIGLTGLLQEISTDLSKEPAFGTNLNPVSGGLQPQIALNHMHNFYYRLDFDLDGSANDVVQRVGYTPTSFGANCANNACGTTSFVPITAESRQTWSATGNTTWLVQDKVVLNADGRRIGYEIKPHYSGIWRGKSDASETWAQHDLFVTRWKGTCENFAARNVAPFIPSGCAASTPQNVSAMVSGESTDGQDVVVWFVNRHHHVTRDEDDFHMPIEWTGFHIQPRSFAESNPAP
jgi:primary-amine oxidase